MDAIKKQKRMGIFCEEITKGKLSTTTKSQEHHKLGFGEKRGFNSFCSFFLVCFLSAPLLCLYSSVVVSCFSIPKICEIVRLFIGDKSSYSFI